MMSSLLPGGAWPRQLVSFGGNFFLLFKLGSSVWQRRGVWVFVLCSVSDSCDGRSSWGKYKRWDVLTNKLYCFIEPGADVSFVVVLDGDALVEEGAFKVVGAVGGDVD